MKKLLTLSVAAYNVENFLAQTLDSLVLPAPDPRLEVIVVDDGSRDGTAALAQQYQQRWPDVVRLLQKENGGYGSTINAASAAAQGEWFKTLDGDDWFDHEALTALLDRLEQGGADLILTDYVQVVQGSGAKHLRQCGQGLQPGTVYPLEQAIDGMCTEMHAFTVRTSLLQTPPLDITEHCYYTDSEYVVNALWRCATVQYWPLCVYQYRIGLAEQSTSLLGRRKHAQDNETVLRKLLPLTRNMEALPLKKQQGIRHRVAQIAHYYVYTLLIFWPSPARFGTLRRFWNEMQRDWPEVWAADDPKVSRVLRASHLWAYLPLSLALIARGDQKQIDA